MYASATAEIGVAVSTRGVFGPELGVGASASYVEARLRFGLPFGGADGIVPVLVGGAAIPVFPFSTPIPTTVTGTSSGVQVGPATRPTG